MYNPVHNRKLIFLFLAILFFSVAVINANAFPRPPNPVMDYVPQNLGIYDTYYENFQ